ncbi:WD repeat-containing protein WRAP73 [Mycena venus]|uniref:WD repeat-containing protein WRAP73 n=1 Tax=Mycena venus TaxID=2733690 RepID=A0A8H6XTP8_9AGAR|nr:WD repeat-containing protein WRAP73 [Mycena venus]
MDFTEVYKHSGSGSVAFSDGSHLILTAIQDRLVLRRADTFQIMQTWLLDASVTPTHAVTSAKAKGGVPENVISHIGFSCDSEYVMAASAKRGVVHVYKVQDESWTARIESGAEGRVHCFLPWNRDSTLFIGLIKAEWAPDGRTVLCFSQWGLRVTVWSLVTGTATYIQFPLHPDTGYTFRSDGRYFVLAERHKSKDTVGVYDTADSYKLVRHFPLPTSSLASLALSPTGNHLAIWEGPIEYKLYVVSLMGVIQGTFCPDPDPGFGIRRVAWHPSGMFLAVGGWDDKANPYSRSNMVCRRYSRALGTYSCRCCYLARAIEMARSDRGSRVFILCVVMGSLTSPFFTKGTPDERLQGPHSIALQRTDQTKPNPKSGAVQLEWNKSGSLLLIRFENSPTVVHIFDFPSPEQEFLPRLRTVLLHSRPVLHARWNPDRKGSMTLCCGAQSLYMWSDEWLGESGVEEEMAECIGVPAKNFETRDVKWIPDGKGVVLLDTRPDKNVFCCAFEVQEEDV